MRSLTKAVGALALAALTAFLALALTIDSVEARSRHKGMSGSVSPRGGFNNTGGGRASPSAVGGNANQPSRPGAQGSGGGGGNSGQ